MQKALLIVSIFILIFAATAFPASINESAALRYSVLFPIAEFSNLAGIGTGISARVYLPNGFFDFEQLFWGLEAGNWLLSPSELSISGDITINYFLLSAGWNFEIFENFSLSPALRYGVLLLSFPYPYTSASDAFSVEQLTSIGGMVKYTLLPGLTAAIDSYYNMFIEADGLVHSIEISAGINLEL